MEYITHISQLWSGIVNALLLECIVMVATVSIVITMSKMTQPEEKQLRQRWKGTQLLSDPKLLAVHMELGIAG